MLRVDRGERGEEIDLDNLPPPPSPQFIRFEATLILEEYSWGHLNHIMLFQAISPKRPKPISTVQFHQGPLSYLTLFRNDDFLGWGGLGATFALFS